MIPLVRCAILASVLMVPQGVRAEAVSPQLVVMGFVEAVHAHDTAYVEKHADLDRIRNPAGHAYTMESLRQLFSAARAPEMVVSAPVYDENTQVVRVRVLKPRLLDIDLQHQNLFTRGGDFYRIIGIHLVDE